MQSSAGVVSEQKHPNAMQALEEGMKAFNEKKFEEAEKKAQLTLERGAEPIIEYPLRHCLASSQASILFFAQQYEQAIDCYTQAINYLELEAQILKQKFFKASPQEKAYKDLKILFDTCTMTVGLLYARRGQIHYFLALSDEKIYPKAMHLANFDYMQAGIFNMQNFAKKLQEITKYVCRHLNYLPQNEKIKNDLSLFACAEKYWEGLALFQETKYDKAIITFKEALMHCPYDANLLEYLANAELATHSKYNLEEKQQLMLSIIKHTSQATECWKPTSTVYLIRGFAYTMSNEFVKGHSDFKLAMRAEIFSDVHHRKEMRHLVENAFRGYIFCQFQLVKEHKLAQAFAAEEKNIEAKLRKDEYRAVYEGLVKLATHCEANQEFGIAENNYCTLLWMVIHLELEDLISPAAAFYLKVVMRRLEGEMDELDLDDIDNLKYLISLLSKNKFNDMKKFINHFILKLMKHAEGLEQKEVQSAKEFYSFCQMLSLPTSELYVLASQHIKRLAPPLKLEAKEDDKKKKKKKAKLVIEKPGLILQPATKLELPKKEVGLIQEAKNIAAGQENQVANVPALANHDLETKVELDLSKKDIVALRQPNKVLTTVQKNQAPSGPISLPTIELKLEKPIYFLKAMRTITYCMKTVGVKQVYLTGESLCESLFPFEFIPDIEVVFGSMEPLQSLKKAFPGVEVLQEGCYYQVKMREDYVVTFRNSEAMNKVVKELDRIDLHPDSIQKIKFQALQEDAKNRNDFTLLLLYAEWVRGKIITYDPTSNQRSYADLQHKRMKCNRETSMALREDPCLLLKAIYYSDVWELPIPETILQESKKLSAQSLTAMIEKMPTRINQWFKKLFLNGFALGNFESLLKTQILEKFIPEFVVFSEQPGNTQAQAILIYLHCVLNECDALFFQDSQEYKPEFNLICATWKYAIQLLQENSLIQDKPSHSGTLFNQCILPGTEWLMRSAGNKWRFTLFNVINYKDQEQENANSVILANTVT